MIPHKLNGILLTCDRWQGNLRLWYGLSPFGVCGHCVGCGANFKIKHGIRCKKWGQVSIRHSDAHDEADKLAALAVISGKVSYEPMIN